MAKVHKPVMVSEVVKILHIKKGGCYADATVGAGGHAMQIIKRGGFVLGIDDDPEMLEIARDRLSQVCFAPNSERDCFKLVQGNFRDIDLLAKEAGLESFDGILFDLGVSSLHYDDRLRGFSFRFGNAPLDMRVNPNKQDVTAADLLNGLREDQLVGLLAVVYELQKAKKVARQIIKFREQKPFKKVSDLLTIFACSKDSKIHPATKVFLALRIAVNSELINLKKALPPAFDLLKRNARLVVISFHSGEDKVVKDFFNNLVSCGKAKKVVKKPLRPSAREVAGNPRSRSARLRAVEKIK